MLWLICKSSFFEIKIFDVYTEEASMTEENIWRRCGTCKKPISLSQKYYACAISTCKKSAYCSMPCFDEHSPVFRHKDAWAEERFAPKVMEISEMTNKISTTRPTASGASSDAVPHDTLVVASKLKEYIRAKSGMNTSASVLERLSDIIRLQCDRAIERAQSDNRKTVMDRDFVI